MTEALEAARWYISQGISVIPVKADGSKAPKESGWPKYRCEFADDDTLVKWFGGPEVVGIGVPTGRIMVMDFENKQWNAYDEWLEHLPDHVRECVEALPSVQTPSGGRHIWCFTNEPEPGRKLAYYAATPDGSGKPRKVTKIETRGEKHQVLAPGSPVACHKAGKPYEWLNSDGVGEVAPPWLWAKMVAAAQACDESEVAPPRAAPSIAPSNRGPRQDPEAERRAELYLANMPEAVEGANGSAATYAAATAAVWGFDLGEEAGYQLLERVYNPRCVPPWSEKELRHKCHDAATKPHNNPKGWLLNAEPNGYYPDDLDHSGIDWGNLFCGGKRIGRIAASDNLPNGSEIKEVSKAIAPRTKAVLRRMSSVTAKQVQWLWQDRIGLGMLNSLVGDPGLGKSFITIDMAARVTRGLNWPDGTPCPEGHVLLITAEDDPETTLRPRLDACGADVDRVSYIEKCFVVSKIGKEEETSFDLGKIDILIDALNQLDDCRLLVIDPIGSYMASGTDTYRDTEVRAQLMPLVTLAKNRGIAVVMVMHTKKGAVSTSADEAALGSRAFIGVARSACHVKKDPDRDSDRLFLPGKSNLSGVSIGWKFCIDSEDGRPASLKWLEPYCMTADEHVAAVAAKASVRCRPGPVPVRRSAAAAWLEDLLENGPMTVKDIRALAELKGYSYPTLYSARVSMGYHSNKCGPFPGVSYWYAPGDDLPADGIIPPTAQPADDHDAEEPDAVVIGDG